MTVELMRQMHERGPVDVVLAGIRWLLVDAIADNQAVTADDILAVLAGTYQGPREDDILRLLAAPQLVTAAPEVKSRFSGMERYLERLPRIIFMTRDGATPATIAAALGTMATPDGVEIALETFAHAAAATIIK
jgi:hypothetical protein